MCFRLKETGATLSLFQPGSLIGLFLSCPPLPPLKFCLLILGHISHSEGKHKHPVVKLCELIKDETGLHIQDKITQGCLVTEQHLLNDDHYQVMWACRHSKDQKDPSCSCMFIVLSVLLNAYQFISILFRMSTINLSFGKYTKHP